MRFVHGLGLELFLFVLEYFAVGSDFFASFEVARFNSYSCGSQRNERRKQLVSRGDGEWKALTRELSWREVSSRLK